MTSPSNESSLPGTAGCHKLLSLPPPARLHLHRRQCNKAVVRAHWKQRVRFCLPASVKLTEHRPFSVTARPHTGCCMGVQCDVTGMKPCRQCRSLLPRTAESLANGHGLRRSRYTGELTAPYALNLRTKYLAEQSCAQSSGHGEPGHDIRMRRGCEGTPLPPRQVPRGPWTGCGAALPAGQAGSGAAAGGACAFSTAVCKERTAPAAAWQHQRRQRQHDAPRAAQMPWRPGLLRR